ncbi:MAG TPA: hypothetical protein ENO09_06170 [bacterium]|nr:hypothetical protein [bacterium]
MSNPHGTFMVIDPDDTPLKPSTGILIIGEPGIGKSHCALALLDRGHALVADDAPLLTRHVDGDVYGECPSSIHNLMEVRGLGMIHVRELFGAGALQSAHRMDMMIRIAAPATVKPALDIAAQQRLEGHWQPLEILGVSIPMLTLATQPAPMLALLIETAARDFALQRRWV